MVADPKCGAVYLAAMQCDQRIETVCLVWTDGGEPDRDALGGAAGPPAKHALCKTLAPAPR
jgi:hypothetical protein